MPNLLVLAPLPALATAVLGLTATVVLDETRLQITFTLDPLRGDPDGRRRAAVERHSLYAGTYLRGKSDRGRFAISGC